MRGLIVQSIWLTLLAIVLVLFFAPVFVVSALVLGFIPFLYLKKSLKKDILKVDVISSIIAFVVLIIVYVVLNQLGGSVDPGMSESAMSYLSIISIDGFLLRGIIFLLLFNVPFLLYFFFGKKKMMEVGNSEVAGDVSGITEAKL